MKEKEKVLKGIAKRWDEEANQRSVEDKGSYMPPEIEMTEKEYETHFGTMGKAQREKERRGLPLYRGSKIRKLRKYL